MLSREVLFHADGWSQGAPLEVSSNWQCVWTPPSDSTENAEPKLLGLSVRDFEAVRRPPNQGHLFADGTASLLSGNASYSDQLLHGTDHWRGRIPLAFGLDVVANHGLAIGDVNGDHLDDLYLCQQGGLPNRLYLQQPDGTLLDRSAESDADWLDYCASALLIDLDNDGNADLVVGAGIDIDHHVGRRHGPLSIDESAPDARSNVFAGRGRLRRRWRPGCLRMRLQSSHKPTFAAR